MLRKYLIIAFLLWHTFAITVYAMPREATDNFSVNVRSVLLPIVRPYVLITHQWQQWNLFAPNPSTTFITARIETHVDGTWTTFDDMQSLHAQNTRRRKLLHHMVSGYIQNPQQLAEKMMSPLCKNTTDKELRLVIDTHTIHDQANPIDTTIFPHTCS